MSFKDEGYFDDRPNGLPKSDPDQTPPPQTDDLMSAGSFGRPHPDVPDQPPQTEQIDNELIFILGRVRDGVYTPYDARMKLQALLTASNRDSRIDELNTLLSNVPMPKLSYEQVENRLAELKRLGE